MNEDLPTEALLQHVETLRTQLGLSEMGKASEKSPEDLKKEVEFLRYLSTIDGEPTTTLARQLIEDGIELPPPDALDGEQLHAKVWEVVAGLAKRRCFLECTDHLSDAELYTYLWNKALNDETYDLDDQMGPCACHLDLVGGGSEEGTLDYLTYYADDFDREHWQIMFPEDELPPKRKRPYDRDSHLPKPPTGTTG